MNIVFDHPAHWLPRRDTLALDAHVDGEDVACLITADALHTRFGEAYPASEAEALQAFARSRPAIEQTVRSILESRGSRRRVPTGESSLCSPRATDGLFAFLASPHGGVIKSNGPSAATFTAAAEGCPGQALTHFDALSPAACSRWPEALNHV
jgi:hypothetical protein